MLAALAQPWAVAALFVWNFGVLSAAQLTIRLIMAYSVRITLIGAVALTVAALAVAAIFELIFGSQSSLVTRIELAPFPMVLMAVAGFAVARWVLRIKRLRGQIIAGLMVGILDPHLFTLF